MDQSTVALLGAGKMGGAFVGRWTDAGRNVTVWNRTPAAAEELAGTGVRAVAEVTDAVRGVPVVVTILTDGPAVCSVLLDQGALEAMDAGATLVDLSTIDVESSTAVAEAAAARGVQYVRGAVSGTPGVVSAGTAGLLLSGPREAIQAAQAVLSDLAPKQAVVGEREESRIVKLAANVMLAGTMELLAEVTVMAETSGVAREVLLDALDASVIASPFLAYKGAALRARDYAPTFTTAGIVKDLGLALRQAGAWGVSLPVTADVHAQFVETVDAGYGSEDFLSVFRVRQATSGLPVDGSGR